jgi:glycosyltransferase involved in cell wall biosynthesis
MGGEFGLTDAHTARHHDVASCDLALYVAGLPQARDFVAESEHWQFPLKQFRKSICVFIPAYNAEKTLPSVIDRISPSAWDLIQRVFIIDDGSNDETVTVANRLANQKIEVFSFPENRGYGSAAKKGLELCKRYKPDYCVCLHADGQYPPEKIEDFVTFMASNGIDILQGSRHKDGTALEGNMPVYKYIAGKILTKLENVVFGLGMTDYHSGYLFYSRHAIESLHFAQFSHSFDFDLEVIASAHAHGMVIDELGIPTRYADETSYLNPITYGFRVLRVVCRYALGAYANPQRIG